MPVTLHKQQCYIENQRHNMLTSFSDHTDVRLSGWIMTVPEYLANLKHLEKIHKRGRKHGLTMH